MAASAVTLYSANKNHINTSDLAGATVKLALISSAYTPDVTVTGHSLFSSVSANEVAATGGYVAGGFTLGTPVSTSITGGFKFSSASPSITASGGSVPAWRYGVLYVSGTLWGLVNPLIGEFLGDSTPADIPATTVGNTLTINTPAGGWFDET
jgi:hypothetical protein